MRSSVKMLGNCHSGFIQNQTVAGLNKLSVSGQDGMTERFNVARLLRHSVPRNDNKSLIFFIAIIIVAIFQVNSSAQSTRGLVNEGVDLYKDQKFADAEVNFKKGVEKNPESFEAKFNLGDAYYKQEKYPDAIIAFQQSLSNTTEGNQRAKVYFNIGNSLLKLKKLNESIKAYKESLKLNPDDIDAKYNLSYAIQLSKRGSTTSPSDPNSPSDYAKQLKAKADELIIKYKYKEAYNLMIEGLKIDPTVGHYKDFIERTKNVVDIEEWI